MWDIKLKVTNEQSKKQTNKKLIDTDNSMTVASRKGSGRVINEVKYIVTEDNLTLGGGHAMQQRDHGS